KFVAYDPFFETANDSYVALATKQSLAGADYAIKKTNGAWSLVGSASSISGGIIRAIIVAAPDCVYLGGGFTNVGDANGDGVVKYNPITNTFTSLGIGGGTVYCMALAPNGDLYVGGIFGSMGGVANTSCMARWDGSAWNSLSATQPNNTVLAMVFDHSGNLYIGGDFTDLADANGDYISKWDGSTYSSLGIGMSGGVYALAVDPGIMVNNQFVNKVVAGGIFTAAGGVANTDKIALWNGSAWTSISSGITGTAVFSLAYGSDYALYAGGLFTVIGGTTASNIAKYVSATWYPLGSGVGSYVYRMMVAGGLLYVGGAFTSAGGLTLGDRVVTWNGTMWGLLDVDLPGSPSVYAIFVNGSETYLGYTTAGTATSSYATTTVTNTGSATSYPTISIKRSGGTSATLQWLKNETTGARLLFNYPILDGEIITIDLTQGSRGITSTYVPLGYNDDGRNIIGSILSGSSLSTWGLAPGSNTISLYISDVGSPTMTAYMIWRPKYWSVDGAIS
ncbi:MAG: phage tail family protein, partial [Armatimonadota bacterium]|nr:phage tail family protein [Armatimonadota bacterium]